MGGSAWFSTSLRCTACGVSVDGRATGLKSRELSLDAFDRWVAEGDVLDVGPRDVADAFPPTALWPPARRMRGLQCWTCPVCAANQTALIVLSDEGDAGWRVVSVSSVERTRAVLASVHGVSAEQREILDDKELAVLDGRLAI